MHALLMHAGAVGNHFVRRTTIWMLLATPSPIRSGMTMMLAKLNGISSATEAATVHSAATPSGASTSSTSESRRRTNATMRPIEMTV